MSEHIGGMPLDFDDGIFTKETSGLELDSVKPQSIDSASVTELDGPDGLHLTAMGNADRFLRDYRQDILWVEGPTRTSAGTFYCFDGQRWQPDNIRATVLAKETVRNLGNLVSQAQKVGHNSDTVTALAKFWKRCETDYMDTAI